MESSRDLTHIADVNHIYIKSPAARSVIIARPEEYGVERNVPTSSLRRACCRLSKVRTTHLLAVLTVF